jgi:hypothetical protein
LADTPITKGAKKMNALNRKENNPNPSRRLRRWFPSRRRRHDPWLVFNMSTFTFDSQPLYGFNRFASHQNIWRSRAGLAPKNGPRFANDAVTLDWSLTI